MKTIDPYSPYDNATLILRGNTILVVSNCLLRAIAPRVETSVVNWLLLDEP